MNVQELIDKLQQFPLDFEVVLSHYPADPDVEPLYLLSAGWYDDRDNEMTYEILEIDTPDERLYRDRYLSECNAVCLSG